MAEYGRHLRPVWRVPLVLDFTGDKETAALGLRMFVALVSGDTGRPDTHEQQVLQVLRDLQRLLVGGAVYPEQRRRVIEPPKPSSYVSWMDGVQTYSGAPFPEQIDLEELLADDKRIDDSD